jgi:hypothetical protein
MTCKSCKFFVFNQNDMMGVCKLNPINANKVPQDWCGQEIPAEYEEMVYNINTDEVKPTGKRKYARKQK